MEKVVNLWPGDECMVSDAKTNAPLCRIICHRENLTLRDVIKLYNIKMPLSWRIQEWFKDGMRKMWAR